MTIEIIETSVGESSGPAVSWPAIAGGAVVAIATTVILFSLGSSLGFGLATPWGRAADTAAHVGVFAGIWLVVVQWLSSAVGGYIAGRMRTRWPGLHTHEVFFRDTAHGFIMWSLATVIMVAIAAWAGMGVAGAATEAGKTASSVNFAYDADRLYRTTTVDPATLTAVREEAVRTLAASAASGGPSREDRDWLIASVAARTGAPAAAATERVDAVTASEQQTIQAAKAEADKARKAAAAASVLTALSLLVGAFIASVSATLGGELRDKHP